MSHSDARLPVLFLNHGSGPGPLMNERLKDLTDHSSVLAGWQDNLVALKARIAAHPTPIHAILLVSAHYEVKGENYPRAGGLAMPPTVHDYHGFPKEAYEFKYPAPGDPELAAAVVESFKSNGFANATVDAERGFDHGVFVPLMALFPEATIPVVPVSIMKSQDVDEHIRLGRSLAKFRTGCLIIGSGATTHNFAYTGTCDGGPFHDRLEEVLSTDGTMTLAERLQALRGFLQWPDAFAAQGAGSASHFMPLVVALGAVVGDGADESTDRTAPAKVAHRTQLVAFSGSKTAMNMWFGEPELLSHLPRSAVP
jgi:aromatic ring-opening dioxygenase catalytic subunit (LigB family)